MCLCAAALHVTGAIAQGEPPLVELINEYRSAPQRCEGREIAARGPLAPDQRLASVEVSAGGQPLMEALSAAGYAAQRAQVIVLTGPDEPREAMRLLSERYCTVVSSTTAADIGVRRDGHTWRIILAKPLLSPSLDEWREAGRKVLELVNRARGEPRRCGERQFAAAPALRWHDELAAAALAHSRDMAKHDYFAHRGKSGSRVGDRARRAGYNWRTVGENIAAGQGSADQVVSAWLASPHHCSNIMRAEFREMGAAYVADRRNGANIYWTQVFGTRAE